MLITNFAYLLNLYVLMFQALSGTEHTPVLRRTLTYSRDQSGLFYPRAVIYRLFSLSFDFHSALFVVVLYKFSCCCLTNFAKLLRFFSTTMSLWNIKRWKWQRNQLENHECTFRCGRRGFQDVSGPLGLTHGHHNALHTRHLVKVSNPGLYLHFSRTCMSGTAVGGT